MPSNAIPDAGIEETELAAATERLLDYYLRATAAADDHLRALPGQPVPDRFTGREQALAWLDAERANLTAAVVLAADTGRYHTAVDLAGHLAEFLQWRRQLTDWVAVADVASRAATTLGDPYRRAATLTILGNALQEVRRFAEAISALTRAAGIYREAGDCHAEGLALNNLGLALREVRRFAEAIGALTRAAGIFWETGDRHREGTALGNLGLALRGEGRFAEAIGAYTQAASIFRETGDRHGEGLALNNLGLALVTWRRRRRCAAGWTVSTARGKQEHLGHDRSLYGPA